MKKRFVITGDDKKKDFFTGDDKKKIFYYRGRQKKDFLQGTEKRRWLPTFFALQVSKKEDYPIPHKTIS